MPIFPVSAGIPISKDIWGFRLAGRDVSFPDAYNLVGRQPKLDEDGLKQFSS